MNDSTTQIKDATGNPAPLGLLGFGMTTVLLNLHNAGFYELNSMILAMGLCYGGAAQIARLACHNQRRSRVQHHGVAIGAGRQWH